MAKVVCDPVGPKKQVVPKRVFSTPPVVCDPLKPVKSGAQSELDLNLAKPTSAYTTFSMISKHGDLVVPANVHIRFYNCVFDNFDASQGNNIFYFEQCVFKNKPTMKDVVAIAAGTSFRQGATVSNTKIELIAHEYPNEDTATNTTEPTVKKSCEVNDTFRCENYSFLKSVETRFEWLQEGFEPIADDLIMSMGILREAAVICGVATAAITGIVSWANKSILELTSFSKLECLLSQFVNIPFTILSMIEGCVAKITNMAFGVLDALLAPFFSCVNDITSMMNSITNLINTVKNIPERIATLANNCYLRIMGAAQLLAKRALFLLDYKSRVELQLNQRIVAVNGSLAHLTNSSKMLLRSCGIVTSPSTGNAIPLIKVSSNSLCDVSRIKFLTTKFAPLFKIESGGKIKLNTVSKVVSEAPPSTAAVMESDAGVIEMSGIEKVESNNTLIKAKDSTIIGLNRIKSCILKGADTYGLDADNCVIV